MARIRIKLTVNDYYEYVGTNPAYRVRKRVMGSLPYELTDKLYSLHFKRLKNVYSTTYRVKCVVETTEERIEKLMEGQKALMFRVTNLSYKVLGQSSKAQG